MEDITIIGELLAHEGFEFIFIGPVSKCSGCKLKSLCTNLIPGRRYRVTEVRDTHHDCPVYERGVRVVGYELLPMEIMLRPEDALEGNSLTFTPQEECGKVMCRHRHSCFPLALEGGERITVAEVNGEPVSCPAGRMQKRAILAQGRDDKHGP